MELVWWWRLRWSWCGGGGLDGVGVVAKHFVAVVVVEVMVVVVVVAMVGVVVAVVARLW